MNKSEVKQIIINEVKPYFSMKGKTQWQTPSNKELFLKLNNKYNNFFQSIAELIYLINNVDDIENMPMFCNMCGKKTPYSKKHYQIHCCQKCAANDPEV